MLLPVFVCRMANQLQLMQSAAIPHRPAVVDRPLLLLVHLCLEVSLLILVADSKQSLFCTLKSLDNMKVTWVLCLPAHICALAGNLVGESLFQV